MTVTKQQQLEWMAKHMDKWAHGKPEAYLMSVDEVGFVVGLATTISPVEMIYGRYHTITREEWQQERDKMQKQPAQPAQDNSWRERGEFPPVGCECEMHNNGSWTNGSRVWEPVKVLAVTNQNVIVTKDGINENVRRRCNVAFRPLRTEREKAIDEMVAVISSMSILSVESIAEKLYDSGYRKVSP